ncbi:MAG TPA: PIN domain-containing protein [Thermoanaerobaculia bacterium]|nr:PIN domain-containing protein [Thermoanaerobaculia bacterium]
MMRSRYGSTSAPADTGHRRHGGDPADRLIVATAIEHGVALVTKDDRIRRASSKRSGNYSASAILRAIAA